jgi:hypothetical protein
MGTRAVNGPAIAGIDHRTFTCWFGFTYEPVGVEEHALDDDESH